MHIVLSAQEMARVERLAIADGLSQEAFMQEAGVKVARIVKRWATKGERILLLVGKGNREEMRWLRAGIFCKRGLLLML